MTHRSARAAVLAALALIAACRPRTAPTPEHATAAIVPAPATLEVAPRDSFLVTARTAVYIDVDAPAEAQHVADYAAQLVASRFGVSAQRLASGAAAPDSSIVLTLDATRTQLGEEGYELTANGRGVRIVAAQPAGLFYGVQTMRQLFPPSIEHTASYTRRLIMPSAHVIDTPRFPWRGAMLDVSRHFMPAANVKRFVDLLALYKINRLHLHLSDDQGWRIEIPKWPRLTEISGTTAIGGAPASFYTLAEYADIVAYARSRFVTIVPEIDMPGHMNAALVAYPDLKCDRVAPPVFDRVGGPPNSLCTTRDSVYQFVGDVVRTIVNIAPTPYFHIGGDEVQKMSKDDYHTFIKRVEDTVTAAGSRMVGWGEMAPVNLSPTTIVQRWNPDSVQLHAARGGKVILSPSPHAYLDMKYDSTVALGLKWAGYVTLEKTYDWNPATLIPGVGESSIMGVEGPLWAETLVRPTDWEYMLFPRITALAELGWSPATRLSWPDYRRRIAAHGGRLAALGVNFARVPGVDWSW